MQRQRTKRNPRPKRAQTRNHVPYATRPRRIDPIASDLLLPHDPLPKRAPERKAFDIAQAATNAYGAYSGSVTSLSSVPQGVSQSARVGDALNMRAIQLGVYAGYAGSSDVVRFVLFIWNDNGTPSVADVLSSSGSSLGVVCPYNFTSAANGKINVIKDWTMIASSVGPGAQYQRFELPLDNPITYDAGATTGQGKLYLLQISSAALTANSPIVAFSSRLLYDD